MAKTVDPQDLYRLARLGAAARLREIEEEAAALRKMFPGLGRAAKTESPVPETATAAVPSKARKRKRTMSPEARAAARERMTAYWVKKKAAQAGAAAQAEEGRGTDQAAEKPARRGKKGGRRGRARRGRAKA